MKTAQHVLGALVVAACLAAPAGPALAAGSKGGFKLDFKGSFTDGQHTRYVPPLANPIFNETPFITTELRPIYLYNRIPDDFLTQGGNIRIVAAEIRVALTERLGIIATSDGFADLNFDAVLPDEDGFVNLSAGLKYAVYSQPETGTIFSIGIEYEMPTGSIETGGISLEGDGDGFIDIFATGAKTFGKWGLQASAGANIAVDNDFDSSFLHYSVHADYEVLPGLFPLVELNGFTTVDHGDRNALNFEGIDLVNFGSRRSGTVFNLGVGARYQFNEHIQFGAGYEMPVSGREDLMDWRLNFDLVLRY